MVGTYAFSRFGVSEKILGIIGLGRIGGRWQKNARWFQCKIIYYDQVRNEEIEKSLNIEYFDLETLLKMADFVGIHVPLLPSTRHLMSEQELKLMKPSAYLINTSRGPVVDEKALVEALKNKTIRGAALDVLNLNRNFRRD